MSGAQNTEAESAVDCDVAVVGGGPAGCSTGIFTARYGLETVVFDRGRSSLRQCAHLENYLGFPGGIDVETFYTLAHDHAEAAGCELLEETVASVDRTDDGNCFAVETQDGRRVRADRVVAATRYGGEYLRPLDDGDMFVSHRRDGEDEEYFDREYADPDGRTPIDGLYVASPVADWSRQAITAAGHGALVGRRVVADVRRGRGYPDDLADRVDWLRRDRGDDEWQSRERWREFFDRRVPDDYDLSEERLATLREAEVDDRLAAYVDDEEIERRRRRAHYRLLDRLDTDLIRAYLDEEVEVRSRAGE